MTWTAPLTATTGALFTAAQYNTYDRDNLNDLRHQKVVKTSSQSVTSSATLVNDTQLLFAIGASESWVWHGVCLVDGATTGDFLMTFTGPASAIGHYGFMGLGVSATDPGVITNGGDNGNSFGVGGQVSCGLNGTGAIQTIPFWGSVVNSTTPGNVTLQWAQRVSDGTATRMNVGSHIVAWRVS